MDEKGSKKSEVNGKKRKRVGLVYDERMCKHKPPNDYDDHPESPDRIRAIWDKLTNSGLIHSCEILNAKKAEDKYIQLVHSKYHVDLIRTLSSKQSDSRRDKIASKFDSIYLNKGSSQAAYLAAGSVLEAAEKVAKGDLDSAFAIVRPPGHHAEENEPMGFCLFNNAAIAARYLLNEALMDFAQGKLILALEGGYNLQSLANSAHACVQVLLEEKTICRFSEARTFEVFESTWRIIKNVSSCCYVQYYDWKTSAPTAKACRE